MSLDVVGTGFTIKTSGVSHIDLAARNLHKSCMNAAAANEHAALEALMTFP